ncbi:MAG: hypothetical protein A3H76_05890 [Candidatus Lloydbacteria bacterium RIFCSPLOWO2_02_FULL_54_12]|nr:MAG: hypothetical protein A3H76_05890 [Candidatus Lloydbacteria bacterium RIFCSPLOWO2_02_FULL_54_12]
MARKSIRMTRIGRLPVWRLSTRSRKLLAMTFVRMQEYYESGSPRFRGRIFTLGEFKDWYRKERGRWSYANDWSGFNVPSYAVHAVYRQFPDHSREEKGIIPKITGLF